MKLRCEPGYVQHSFYTGEWYIGKRHVLHERTYTSLPKLRGGLRFRATPAERHTALLEALKPPETVYWPGTEFPSKAEAEAELERVGGNGRVLECFYHEEWFFVEGHDFETGLKLAGVDPALAEQEEVTQTIDRL